MNPLIMQRSNQSEDKTASIKRLTNALETVIYELAGDAPQTVSIFFDGAEVYRYQLTDGSVAWWAQERSNNTSSVSSVSSASY